MLDIKTDKKTYTSNEVINVSFDVSNTGNTEGAEVVQVYVGKPKSKVKRALKELKGFSKVRLNKGEKKAIIISIDVKKLAYYNEAISNWDIEKGPYYIYVGNASNNIYKKIRVSVE